MKSLWVLNHYAVLPDETGSTRHHEILSRLAVKDKWSCVIIASSFSHWEKKQKITACKRFFDKTQEHVLFRFIWTSAYRNNGFSRVVNMFIYFLNIIMPFSTSNLPGPDIIIGSSVHPLAALAAEILAKRFNVPFVFEVRDLWPETLIAMGRLKKDSLAAKLMCMLEHRLYRRAHKIITLLPEANSYISRYGISADKIEWIPNGVDIASGIEEKTATEVFTFMYVGAHGEANALDIILDAIKYLKGREFSTSVVYRFIGEGEAKERLIAQSNKYGLDNVIFEDGISKDKVAERMAGADAFILSLRDLPQLYKYGISMNKIFEYLAAGRPVIAALGAANNPVKEANAGITVEAENPVAMADAIEQMLTMPVVKRNVLGRQGRAYVKKHHDYNLLAEKFNTLLNDLVEKGR